MSAYLLLPLMQTFFSLMLIAIALRGHFRNSIHRLFSLFLLGLAIWGVMIFGMRASPDIGYAYSWERWLVTVAPFTSVFFYHFAIRYTATRVNQWLLPFLYLICFLFLPLAATGLVVSGMQIKPYGYAPIFGPVMPFHLLFNYGMFMMALLAFVRAFRIPSDAEQRNRAAYIIIGMIFSFIGATFDILPILGLPLYPGYIIGNILFCLLTAVAIVRYNLLDIQVVLRKSAAYALVSTIVAVPVVGTFIVATRFFGSGTFPTWGYIVLLVALAIALPQLWQRIQQRVDRWFYRDRYDYLKALEAFSQETQSLIDSTTLGSITVKLIAKALRSSTVCLLQPLPHRGDFTTAFSFGVNNATPILRLKRLGALVKWLERSNSILSYEDIEIIPQLQSLTSEEKQSLKQVGAELIIPLKTPTGQLSAILILGKKLSEQPYTGEDKQLIFTISSQMATSLENARLYDDALRARQNLEAWLNSMTDSVMIVNMDYSVQFMNKAAIEYLGTSGNGVCFKALGKDTRCSNCPIARYLLGNRESFVYGCSIGDRQYDVAVAPLLNPDGSTSIIEVFRDVTERKQAEEALRQQRDQAQAYLDIAGVMIVAIDSKGKVTLINRRGCEIIGYEAREIIGKDWFNHFLPARFRAEVRKVSQSILAGEIEPVSDYENPVLTKSGQERIIAWHTVTLKDEAGNLIGHLSSGEDITMRKQAEEALRESREKLRLMFESVTDGILVLDLNGVITEVNQRTLEMHGFNSKDELLGKNIFELVPPGDRERAANNMHQTMKRGAIRGMEYTMLKTDGSEFPVEVSASMIKDATGNPIGHIAIGRDITERKRMEEKERQFQQELYRSSRLASIGELAAGVAHEINNPLTGVVGFSQRLLRKATDEEVRRSLEIIHSEASRAAKIIQNLLIFARRGKPKKQYLDINDILQSALELRAYELTTSNIEIVTNLATHVPKTLVDSHQIQEVFLNIILNAEQAMIEAHGRGKLIIKTKDIKDYIRISFADDGPGIPSEHLDKLFDPFFTTREERGGTGLGLSVCHGIVTDHGGRIYVKSKLGKGTIFFVELPLTA